MKFSINEAQNYSNVPVVTQDIDALVQKIGAQLGAVETVENWGHKYDGVIVAKVVSCDKHPNADKLNICWVDDAGVAQDVERNEAGHVQVVCGAPNVRAGLTVAWLPPGSTVPTTVGTEEPFVLGARELRGVVSNGMLASAQELGISDDHTGILEIEEPDIQVGSPFKQLYGLDDTIIEIENKMFTHRPDCFGVLGVAREVAGIQDQAFSSPEWYSVRPQFDEAHDLEIEVDNQISELVPRFMAVAMKNVAIKPSPVWLQALLNRVGIKPINNVVDVTNYLAYVTAQPLHAYDYDKVKALSHHKAKLVVRKPHKDEQIALLNGKTITPRTEAIMIATDKEVVGIGGVMGGSTTEVDQNTQNIIIEVATFDMYSIRRTSMTHGLFTDAVTRNNKGQSPLQNDRVIAKAISLMNELAHAEQASNVIDTLNSQQSDSLSEPITITPDFINVRLGTGLSKEKIISLLANVEIKTNENDAGELVITAPFWRTDLAIREDIVEEVGRLYGFDKLALEMPPRPTNPTKVEPMLAFKHQLRTALASFGASEVLTYSFVHGNLLQKAGQDPSVAFKLTNALSPELQYFRINLLPSILSNVHSNIKAGHTQLALFEIGKGHINFHKDDDNGVPKELEMVSLVVANKSKKGAAFYEARAYLNDLGQKLGIKFGYLPIKDPLDFPIMQQYDQARTALVVIEGTDTILGAVGEFTASVRKGLKLPEYCAGFELSLGDLLAAIPTGSSYAPLSRYPSISQDICLEVSENTIYETVATLLDDSLQVDADLDQTIAWHPVDIYQSEEIAGKKRFTFRVTLTSYQQTMTENVLSNILQAVTNEAENRLGAIRI